MSDANAPPRDGITDTRIGALVEMLALHGVDHAAARAGGPSGEIAIIEAPMMYAARLAELADRIRTIGFRYVAIDLGSDSAR